MECLNLLIMDAVTASSVNFVHVWPPESNHTLSWSVKPQGTSVSVTCACKSKCTWVFKSPAMAARWGLLFLTEPIVAVHGAIANASLTLWYPSNGIVLKLRGVQSGGPSEMPIRSTNGCENTEPDEAVEYLPDLPF